MLKTAYDKLSALKASGKSMEEAVAAKPLTQLEERWGGGMLKGDKWVTLVYGGLD